MMSQTHILVAAAAFAKPGDNLRNSVVIAGSIIPDFALYALFANAKLQGVSSEVIFTKYYWSEGWQQAMAPGNSFVLFGALLVLGIFLVRRPSGGYTGIGLLVALFAASALLHILLDFPLHVDDAHSHFWPVSEWKFVSPISYWDDNYHAGWVRPVEYGIAIVALIVLIRRFRSLVARIILSLVLLIYIVGPFLFRMNH